MWEISAVRRGLRTSLGVGALALTLVLPPAAAAAPPRYASPTGTNTADCPQSDPCDLPNAMNGATTADGDVVIVLPGTYSLALGVNVIDESITLQGQAGQPVPHIEGAGSEVIELQNAVTVRRLWLDSSNSGGGNGIYIGAQGGGSLVEQTLIESNGSEACFLEVPSVTLSDTVCATRADGIAGLFAQANGGDTSTVTLRNVTAIASGQDQFSPAVIARASGMNAHILIQGRNVLAAAGQFDVAAEGHSGDATSSAAVNLTASNYDGESETDGGTVTDPGTGGNQTAAPLLATDGFHQLSGSPTIDAGTAAPALGSGDIDAEPRLAGTAVDIGADEFQPPAPPAGPTPPANPPANPPPNQGPTAKCRGKAATIVGTGGPLNGTPKRDVIVGSPRRDMINAGRGADLVCARAGNDKVLGGAGPDTLLGQAGKDRLMGGGARDLLLGGPAIDVLRGGPGRDVSRQ